MTTEAISLLVEVGTNIGETSQEILLHTELQIPIAVGDVVGYLVYYVDGEVYQEVPLTVEQEVERASFVALWTATLGQLIFGQ